MTNRPFGATIRDFSKTAVARQFLNSKFRFDAIPHPNLSPIGADENVPPNLLGATFDYLLLLLIERCNPNFIFQVSFSRKLKDGRSKSARALKDYFKTGTLSDALIDELILHGEARQKSFQQSSRGNKLIISDSLRIELRRMHQLAEKIDWQIEKSFQQGWLTGGHLMNAIPDVVLDSRLIEVKAVKDAKHHDEYLSQVFSYYIMFQFSQKRHAVSLDDVGLYYARHGVLVKNKITEIIRFPLAHLKRIAFDYEVEFQYWRDKVHPLQPNLQMSATELEQRRWMSFNNVLSSIHPKPDWLERALKKRFKRTKQGVVPQQIKIPKDFLIG
jgi:hypothetical protein